MKKNTGKPLCSVESKGLTENFYPHFFVEIPVQTYTPNESKFESTLSSDMTPLPDDVEHNSRHCSQGRFRMKRNISP